MFNFSKLNVMQLVNEIIYFLFDRDRGLKEDDGERKRAKQSTGASGLRPRIIGQKS